MPMKTRVHIIDPKKRPASNDNNPVGKASDQALVHLITPDNLVPAAQTRKRHGLPHPNQFSQPGLLALVIDRFLADDAAFEGFQHKVLHLGIVGRFQHALDLASNPEALAEWKKNPRVVGLARPPKSEDDICRALFRASYLNPKDSSKRFKRIEHLWKKREPAGKVLAFLNARGLQDPPKAQGKPGESDDTQRELLQRATTDAGDSREGKSARAANARTGSEGVHISNLAPEYAAGKKVGDTVALAGVILSKQGNSVVLKIKGCG